MSTSNTGTNGDLAVPDLLFRCCSDKSVGRLLCGQLIADGGTSNQDTDLTAEFLNHKNLLNRRVTRLISSTTSLLWVLQLAFQKQHAGESNIEIIFISPHDSPLGEVFHAPNLARQSGLSSEKASYYEHEYLWHWKIPEECIHARVDLKVLESRGLTLTTLIGSFKKELPFPRLSEFSSKFKNFWVENEFIGRSFALATAACRFGYDAPVRRIFWILFENSLRAGEGWGQFSNDIQEILTDELCSLAADVSARMLDFDTDLADLSWEWHLLHYEHAERLNELVYPLLEDAPALDRQLQEENDAFEHSTQHLQKCLRNIRIEIGH
ncbi:hypothetical protein M409DRAFT_71487 [Zasmidium cellare ATCC 36951]|uniref:DUF7587 domain-containing protein n=1 Tax=Zasmidium cellare ATCC 36951 TaxID=1080233 RepID=A0A6A6BVL6_ZASCE|nr:uncharacterized protein M409DRAFT_71487 [Zasmidium cellare ATCC 36951]KAF2158735.1 hypothetical protein M409DRAFT_71487 [Zasmidium cellare ATCC 36951]